MANTYSQIYLHFVIVVKRRENLIPKEHKEEVHKYISGLVAHRGCKMLAIHCMPDHTHFFVGFKPVISISDFVKEIKVESNQFINSKQWTKTKFAWQEGYGVFSYSQSHLTRVINYIRNQETHHAKKKFKDEYRQLLKKFEIRFEEKYLFDFLTKPIREQKAARVAVVELLYLVQIFNQSTMNLRKSLMMIGLLLGSLPTFSQTEIGLQLYSLRNQFKTEVPGTLAKVSEWGIREVEGGGTYGLPMEDFQKLLKDNKLKVVSVGAEFNDLKINPQAAVDNAKAFGAKYVVCFWIPHNGDEFTFDNIKEATDVFNKAGKFLQENGLSLCYHPHGYEFRPYESGTLFDYLVKNTDPKYLNFEMDVFWIKHPGQDPVTLLEKYPKRFLLMHLKDRKPGTPGNQNGHADVESNVVLGQGDVGIDRVMAAAKKAGVKHYFIEDESSHSLEQIPQSLAYLKSLNK